MRPGPPPETDPTTAAAPLTRRALREQERARSSRARRPQPAQRSRRSRVLPVVAMVSVLGIGIGTSLPAMALLTGEQLHAQSFQAAHTGSAATADDVQALDRVESSRNADVLRESAEVTAAEQVAALKTMRIADTFTNNPRGAIQWPFPVGVPITSEFGPRVAPTEGASTNHLGVDFAPGAGVPIQIIADGVVREVVLTDNGGCGVNVTIDHLIGGALVSSKYCHLQSGSVRVTAGQAVTVAQIVGKVGNTGVSTGAHLHFEIRLDGTRPVDPYAWLKANAS